MTGRPLNHSERGLIGAHKRWGNPANRREIRIADLSPDQKAQVLRLIEEMRASNGRKPA